MALFSSLEERFNIISNYPLFVNGFFEFFCVLAYCIILKRFLHYFNTNRLPEPPAALPGKRPPDYMEGELQKIIGERT